MSDNTVDAQAFFARRMERAGDLQRMLAARRDVVARARASVLGRPDPANDVAPEGAA